MDHFVRRGPRPSLAIFDPLSSIDLASLPPLPATPPGTDEGEVKRFSRISLADHGRTGKTDGDAGWTPLMNPYTASTSRSTQLTANEKLIDIVTPMPTHRTLQPIIAAESRNIVPMTEEDYPSTVRKVVGSEGRDDEGMNGKLVGARSHEEVLVEGRVAVEVDGIDETPKPKQGTPIKTAQRSSIFSESQTRQTPASVSLPSRPPIDDPIVPGTQQSHQQPSDESLLPIFTSPQKSTPKPAHSTTAADTTRFHGFSTVIGGDVFDLMGDDKSFMDAMMGSPSDSAEAESTRQLQVPGGQQRPEPLDKGKGKARMADVGCGHLKSDQRETIGPRQGFGSVLAGMAEYEASIGRHPATHVPQEGDTSVFQLVVSKASDSPSVASVNPGSPRGRPNFTLLAVADQTGDVSTLFPSSPSIKRYMNTQAHPGSASSADESRLDMVDLSDLRSVRIDERIAEDPDTSHQFELDRSTIYPSSPAVKRNMARSTMDLMRDVQVEELDSRLEQSVCLDKGKRRETKRPIVDSLPSEPSSSAVFESPTKRARRPKRESGDGNQTMDLGAMIKRTSRKLTTDCGDMTFLAPPSRMGGRGVLDQSLLMDVQSPFKRGAEDQEVEESYYDLLGGDNTFMKQVEDVTIGDDSPVKGNILPPGLQSRHPVVAGRDDSVFKVPALPSKMSPPKNSQPLISTSPMRSRTALPPNTRDTSPVRSAQTSGALSTPARQIGTARTMFTPAARATTSDSTPRRHLSSDYRSTTTLPPRTPLAERGFGPQTTKKVSSSSISTVLGETDGRSVNIRGQPTNAPGGMKKSATMSDFTPIKQNRLVEKDETPRRRYGIGHTRSPSDSAAGVRANSMIIPNAQKRPSILGSPTRLGRTRDLGTAGSTSTVRLPGQGLRQVSGQSAVDDPDARTRKQAMSPEKLLQRVPRTAAAPQASNSPSRCHLTPRIWPITNVDRASLDISHGKQLVNAYCSLVGTASSRSDNNNHV
ncbi:hypothetical protein NCC49_005227 [Naganishia albida]|nr:hypothetical protein NCC49_005227 [Naganishia albida]